MQNLGYLLVRAVRESFEDQLEKYDSEAVDLRFVGVIDRCLILLFRCHVPGSASVVDRICPVLNEAGFHVNRDAPVCEFKRNW